MMKNSSLRDYLLKDRPGEEFGQRAEAVVTMSLGFLATALSIFAYQNPIVYIASAITNAVAIFTLIQAIRGRYNFLILFPTVTALSICLVAIVEGEGVHDLIWMGNIGLHILVNVYSRRNNRVPIIYGIAMIALFIAAGLAEIYNILPNPRGTDLEYILLNSFFFLTIMGATTAVFHRHRALLDISIKNRNEQILANQRLQEANRNLEDLARARTDDLNKANDQLQIKTMRLQAASEISQELMANINEDPEELLMRATRSISEKFGFYHVGIFLLNDNHEYAVLRAANSKGGQQMLSRRHQLRVGGAGIVGYVSQSGKPRIALDTGADAVFFNNPDLPETRSEIAIPLKYGLATIGVLDVQSTKSSAFTMEDANTLSTLANQLAIVIRNLQTSDDGAFSAYTKKGRRTAASLTEKQSTPAYSFKPDGSISSARPGTNPTVDKAIASGEIVVLNQPPKGNSPTLAVPVKLRDQVIGVLHIESSESSRKWTEEEVSMVQAISERAALALENARLLENATRRAEQEQTIAHVTTQIGASSDFDRILQTTIQELGQALKVSRTFIQLTPPSENGSERTTE
ncbi:MAG: GAF domain-containing protein [Anaerolineales bacterium]|nr:GAF domain-containing protein [Anaerolineales bacterium]